MANESGTAGIDQSAGLAERAICQLKKAVEEIATVVAS